MKRLLLLLLLIAVPAEAGVLFNNVTDKLTASTFTVPQSAGTLCLNLYPNWAQTDNTSHQVVWITTGTSQFEIAKFPNNFISIGWQNAGTSYKVQTTSYTLNQSAWNSICVTWNDSSNATVAYLNGTQIGTVASLVTWDTSAQTLNLGNINDNSNLDGRLAEVAFWNRVLTTEELNDRMGGLLSNCISSGLINYWPLVSTSDLTDKAGTENLTNSGVTDAADHPSTTACGGGGSPTIPSPTVILGSGDTINETDQTSYTTATFPITGNKLYTFAVTSRSATTPNTPTITCHSMTWVSVASVTCVTSNVQRTTVFRGMRSTDSSTATCSIDFAGQTQTRAGWIVEEWAGTDTSGTNGSGAVVQSATNSAAASNSLTITLSAYSSSNNRPAAFFAVPESGGGHSPEAGWTELVDQASGTENLAIIASWRDNTADSTPSYTRDGGTNTEWCGVALEIKAGTAAAATNVGIIGGGVGGLLIQ